ncbi:MAG: lysyl oxidase family protein [Solirubrobacterales bacterium]|nr:lysyl oxidase family protein [Solirubrobacterales bacterium]
MTGRGSRLRVSLVALSGFLMALAGVAALGPPSTVGESVAATAAGARVAGSGPCANPKSRAKLLCPDLKVAWPRDLAIDRTTRPGKALLRSTNDIRSRGLGPIELRGRRDRPRSMATMQAIRRRGGGYALYPSQMRLRFHNVGARYGGAYWKAALPLRFELWKIDGHRRRVRLARVGPKQFYCLRDLERTRPGRRSPRDPVYPACNQNPRIRKVTLGTSVGWSDIYPSTYDEQWINVTGLRGCFAYVLKVDPLDRMYELNERNNASQRIVRLPWRGNHKRGC